MEDKPLEEKKPPEEELIILDQINYEKGDTSEAIGVPKEEIESCMRKIRTDYKAPRDLLKKLGLTEDELYQVMDELLAVNQFVMTKSSTKVIANLWKKRGRKEITLVEYVGTSMLIADALLALQDKGVIKIIKTPETRNTGIYI